MPTGGHGHVICMGGVGVNLRMPVHSHSTPIDNDSYPNLASTTNMQDAQDYTHDNKSGIYDLYGEHNRLIRL